MISIIVLLFLAFIENRIFHVSAEPNPGPTAPDTLVPALRVAITPHWLAVVLLVMEVCQY